MSMPKPTVSIFSCDLDGTILGNVESVRRFKTACLALPNGSRPSLYSSGPLVDDWQLFIAAGTLPEIEFYIGGVGTHQVYNHPWEFDEWVHGQTGQPLGKAFQAWSAASFLRACCELDADPKSRDIEQN